MVLDKRRERKEGQRLQSENAVWFEDRTRVVYVLKEQKLLQTVYQMTVQNQEKLEEGPHFIAFPGWLALLFSVHSSLQVP